jgi:hypothetical protein
MTRIHWKDGHKLALAEASIEYMRIYPKAHLLTAVKQAQRVLPEELRRTLNALSDVEWIHDFMQIVHDMRAQSAKEVEKQNEVQQAQTALESNNAQTMQLSDLTTLWLDRFFNEFVAPRIAEKVETMVTMKATEMLDSIQMQMGDRGRLQIVTPKSFRPTRTKVLILGLLGQQVTVVKDRFGKELDLTMVGSDHKHDGLVNLAKSHDVGIVMTRFVNHSASDQVTRNSPNPMLVSGAISDLSTILTSIINEHKREAA